MSFTRFRALAGMSLVAVLGLVLGALYASRLASAAPGDAQIHACVARSEPNTGGASDPGREAGGAIHIVSAGIACPRGQEALAWNVQGPPGPPGSDSIAKIANQHCPPGQFVNSFAADGTPICQPPLSPAGSAVVGGGTDNLQSGTQIGMFAWGNGGISSTSSFTERYGVIPVGGTLANFTVDIQYAPPAATQWTFSLVAATPDHSLTAAGPNCTIPAGKYECLAAGVLAVQPGWTIFVLAGESGTVPGVGMASWGATFQPGP